MAVLTYFGKHSYKEEGNNVVNLQIEWEKKQSADIVCTVPAPTAFELSTLFLITWKQTLIHSCQERESRHLQTCSLIL